MQEWLSAILADDNYWDQNAFNDLMRRGAQYLPRRDDRLFKFAFLLIVGRRRVCLPTCIL